MHNLLRISNLAYPMIREPKTDPIPAPDPATPTVAAPAPMNLAAESMSLLTYNNGLCQKTFHFHSQCPLAIRLTGLVWRHLTAAADG